MKSIENVKDSNLHLSELNDFERWQNIYVSDPISFTYVLEKDKIKYNEEVKQNAIDIGNNILFRSS
jgi:hypothetical protein